MTRRRGLSLESQPFMRRKKVSGFSSQAHAIAMRIGSCILMKRSRPALAMACFTSSRRGFGSSATHRERVGISVGIFPSDLTTLLSPPRLLDPERLLELADDVFFFGFGDDGLRFTALIGAPPFAL